MDGLQICSYEECREQHTIGWIENDLDCVTLVRKSERGQKDKQGYGFRAIWENSMNMGIDRKQIFRVVWILLLLFLCMAGFDKKEAEITMQAADIAEKSLFSDREIPVDFPFPESDGYSLSLVQKKRSGGEYELRLYDGDGGILQRISCGALTEPIQFSYDYVYRGVMPALEIFSSDCSTGLLFKWNGERFSENGVVIPRYEENRGLAMLTVEDEKQYQVKKIYELNELRNCVEEVREWKLEKSTGFLTIWDCLEDKKLFEGIVVPDEEGNPANSKYYDMLLWDDLYVLWDYEGETAVPTWIGGAGAEGRMYESREALLTAFGFWDSVPMYQYYDRYSNLKLELYMEESTRSFCGIVYLYFFNSDKKKCVELYGFTVNDIQQEEWEEGTFFSLESLDGTSGADNVEAYQEIKEYTQGGRPDSFKSQGLIEHGCEEDGRPENVLITLVELDFVYRDDGTLYYRDYAHNSFVFGTTLCTLESYYDEYGRASYETGYVTHGKLEYYYIYEDEGAQPVYCLELDYNGGYVIPGLIRYKS